MEIVNHPLREHEGFLAARRSLQNNERALICGCGDAAKPQLIAALSEGMNSPLVLTYSESRARQLAEEYSFYGGAALVYPAKDLIFYQADINGRATAVERLKVLRSIVGGEPCAVFTTIDALLSDCPPAELLKSSRISFKKNDSLDVDALQKRLVELGYEKSYQAQTPGQFSMRGGIFDIFDLTAENPCRIELWGDTIESLRSFDAQSQRSLEELDSFCIHPASELFLSEEKRYQGYHAIKAEADKQAAYFRDKNMPEAAGRIKLILNDLEQYLLYSVGNVNLESYLHYFYDKESCSKLLSLYDSAPPVFLDEPARLMEHINAITEEFRQSMSHRLEGGYVLPGQLGLLTSAEELSAQLSHYACLGLVGMDSRDEFFGGEAAYSLRARTLASYNGSFSSLVSELKALKKRGERVLILTASRSRAKRLSEDLTQEGVVAAYTEDKDRILKHGEVMCFYGRIRKGYAYEGLGFTVIAETDIFGSEKKNRRKRPKFSGGTKLSSIDGLHVGDYVIHEDYGVGIYRGIEEVEVEHVRKDYMKIEYRDGGNLYVLATALDKIQLYADKDEKKPKLNKLGTQEWNKTKSKVRTALASVAKDLVELYALRSRQEGYRFGPDTAWQREFEELFPYEETEDQLLAISATKDDMESGKIMDRLICGDVGFGKTEVAIRAAFKAVQEGKQVAYLVPTTILAEQHYNTFKERMAAYPVRIEMLSRFRTAGEIKKTLKELESGMVDIVIGTHRLLSKDVHFSDLGLLVIDEEQRFGVAHKERIKQLRKNVDVLTLTATPIPRTLHMSLVGIRDMSLLEEPPRDRLPIQTFVCEYNEEMVREAIGRELSRGGQVYYVYNRVESIAEMSSQLAALVPEARVAYAHGQMQERELEDIMLSFIHREIDVLISTTIIETGLDIPNVNTIIIHDSDRFGLSQLYQLRGRVGRSDRTSFAFLMYRRDKVLKEVAEKRLSAIREFTELGSGYRIAMRDLEIRGAGTLLGKQQHGHIESVGYDLYCRMLEEAVREEKGETAVKEEGCTIDLDVDAFLPPEYIVNELQKLDLYKRIAQIKDKEDADSMRDELRDRFGALPKQAENLLRIALIKATAASLYITDIRGRVGRLSLKMDRNAPLDTMQIPMLINEYAGALRLSKGAEPRFDYTYEIEGLAEPDEKKLLEQTEGLVESFSMLYPGPLSEAS